VGKKKRLPGLKRGVLSHLKVNQAPKNGERVVGSSSKEKVFFLARQEGSKGKKRKKEETYNRAKEGNTPIPSERVPLLYFSAGGGRRLFLQAKGKRNRTPPSLTKKPKKEKTSAPGKGGPSPMGGRGNFNFILSGISRGGLFRPAIGEKKKRPPCYVKKKKKTCQKSL